MTANGRHNARAGIGRMPDAWLARRAAAFANATTRWPGKQHIYGVGKEPVAPPPKKKGKK